MCSKKLYPTFLHLPCIVVIKDITSIESAAPKKVREKKIFKVYPPRYVHVDITNMRTEEGKLYLFVGIESTTKFCFTRLYKNPTADTAVKFLKAMHASFPNLINKLLTDNGAKITRYKGDKEGHIFTQTCKALKIEHQPYHPWTNGQVGSMNRTIKEATVKFFYYKDHSIFEKHRQAFINAYNYTQSLKALKGLCPYEKVCLYLRSEQGESYLNPKHKIADVCIFLYFGNKGCTAESSSWDDIA